jgi:hypothetical protein
MVGLRILSLAIVAAALAGCAIHIPLQKEPDSAAAATAEPDQAAKPAEAAAAEQPSPPEPTEDAAVTGSTPIPQPKPADYRPIPKRGSPEWKKQRAEEARKEQHIKEVIEGICSGC